MSSLHPTRLVDEGKDEGKGVAVTATTETSAPARGTSRHRAGYVAEPIASTVPSQRQGTASPTGTTSVSEDAPAGRSTRGAKRPAGKHAAAKRPAGKAATAAGSLAAKAKAATAAAAASTTARAAGKAASARTAAGKAATAGAASARTAAVRATTAAKAAAKPVTAKAAAKPVTVKPVAAKQAPKSAAKAAPETAAGPKRAAMPAGTAESAVTAPELAATAPARPTPYRRTASDAPVVPTRADAPAAGADAAPVVVAELQTDPAEVVPALAEGRGSWLAPRRFPADRRRPAFYLAAGLIGAVSMGMLVQTDPAALAETSSVSRSVSVAEQLGIEAQPAGTLSDAESARQLQGLVASRQQRDAAQVAAADAQQTADFFALVAAAEAARPKAVAPVNGARLTSGFGPRWGTLHAGVDLAAPMRTPEYAAMDGVVLEAGPASGFGLAVYIQHDNGDVTVYGHMDEILVQAGQVVRAGDTIALVGNRGQSTGPHLHFEVRSGGLNGPKVDPISWLSERGVQI